MGCSPSGPAALLGRLRLLQQVVCLLVWFHMVHHGPSLWYEAGVVHGPSLWYEAGVVHGPSLWYEAGVVHGPDAGTARGALCPCVIAIYLFLFCGSPVTAFVCFIIGPVKICVMTT